MDTFDDISKPYMSGQISGLPPARYHENFENAAIVLAGKGLHPINPLQVVACPHEDCNAEHTKPDGSYLHSWKCYMKYDIQLMMMECDSIALLPNWKYSKGAQLELHVARELEYPMLFISRNYKAVSRGSMI